MSLLTTENAKTTKGEALGWRTAILYLSPERSAGLGNLCPNASPGCIAACLNTAGRGAFAKTQDARKRKTEAFFADASAFADRLALDIEREIRYCAKHDMKLCVRLNGTSDILWERIRCTDGRTLMERFPDTQFYDYTKRPGRTVPANYHLTFSRSEVNDTLVALALDKGMSAAVVFSSKKGTLLPTEYKGRPVTDGDLHDLRFLDAPGTIVGLRAKGKAKGEKSGFMVHVA